MNSPWVDTGDKKTAIEITKSGKTVARLCPAPGKMSGKTLAALLRQRQPDFVTANEIDRVLKEQETYERSNINRHGYLGRR